jgi:hypothetical protein
VSVYVQLHHTRRIVRRRHWFWSEVEYKTEPLPVQRLPWRPGATPLHWDNIPPNTTITHVSIWDSPEGGWCIWDDIQMEYPINVPLSGHEFDLTDLDITFEKL